MGEAERQLTADRIEAARARSIQAIERMAQIRLRLRELAGGARGGADAQRDRALGHLRLAKERAEEAVTFSIRAYRSAAAAHDRIAAYHELCVRERLGDVEAHRRAAARHRTLAEQDRRSAGAAYRRWNRDDDG